MALKSCAPAAKLNDWKAAAGGKATIGTFQTAAAFGDLLVIAVKGTAAEALIQSLPADAIKGKTIIDVNNPIAEKPPINGVLQYFTGPNDSLMERLQKIAPQANLGGTPRTWAKSGLRARLSPYACFGAFLDSRRTSGAMLSKC